MSRLEIPITGQKLWATGDIKFRADISLLLKDLSGIWWPCFFQLDSGSEITTFSAYEAKRRGLPLPLNATPGVVHVQTGLEVRSGYLRFQIIGLDSTEYVVSCLFLGDPDVSPVSLQAANFPQNLLQPFALLDFLRFTIDRDPATGTLYGEILVEKK